MKAGNPLNQVVRKYEKIVVVGAIGQTERENRDNMRVVARGGCIYNLKAHIQVDKPLVVREWIRKKK